MVSILIDILKWLLLGFVVSLSFGAICGRNTMMNDDEPTLVEMIFDILFASIYIAANLYMYYWFYKFEVAYYHQFGTLLPW